MWLNGPSCLPFFLVHGRHHTSSIFVAFTFPAHKTLTFLFRLARLWIGGARTRTWTIWRAIRSYTSSFVQVHFVSYSCKLWLVNLEMLVNSSDATWSHARSALTFNALYHLRENLGRPRTVLCQTTGKLVREQKFCVIATVLSRFKTTCHHPPGTNTVSPGRCKISNCNRYYKLTLGTQSHRSIFCTGLNSCGQSGLWVRG